jgi:hypothetical protein
MNLERLADYVLKFFKSKERGEGREAKSIYVLEDRHPTWVYDMVYAVHDKGKWFPDDIKYDYIVAALDLFSEGVDPDEPQIEPDVYNSDLIKWLASHGNRTTYVDEAVSNFGWDENGGVISALSNGQLMEREEVFHRVHEALEERLRDIDLGEEEVFKKRGGKTEGWQDWVPES